MRAPARWLAALLCASGAGCIVTTVTYGGPLPDDVRLAAITPGTTSRDEVAALLGPPSEYRTPWAGDRLRIWDPATIRVAEERDVFGRRIWTWVRERREDDQLLLVPFFTIFQYRTVTHAVDRMVVLFDEAGTVQACTATREIAP